MGVVTSRLWVKTDSVSKGYGGETSVSLKGVTARTSASD
jgi:hypothetical protein